MKTAIYLALFYYQTSDSVYPHENVVGIFDDFKEACEAVKKEMEKPHDYPVERIVSGYVHVYEMNGTEPIELRKIA